VPARYVLHKQCLDQVRHSFDYRTYALARDGRVCSDCPGWRNDLALKLASTMGRERRVDVDHIIPLGAGGPNEPTNLQVLCKHHHRVKTRKDLAAMRGRAVSTLRRPVPVLMGITGLFLFARLVRALTTAERADVLLPILGVILWALVGATLVHGAQRRVIARLRGTIVEVTQDSSTKRGIVRARHWRLQRIPGLWIPRYRPLHVEIRYPHTFPDHDPHKQDELEARVASKMGGTWYGRWNTTADRVILRSPDPLVALEGLPWPNADAPKLSLWDPIPVGVGEDGQPVTIRVIGKNLLIGGEPESGKSVAQNLITATAALDPDVVLYGIDGKRMIELAPWAKSMERLVSSQDDAIELLENLQTTMDFRYDLLVARRGKKVERGDGLDLHVLIIDELALFTASGPKLKRERFTELLRDIIARGRAAGIIVVAATQRPSANVVSTDVRDLVGYRWALRTTTPQSSDMILGQGQASAGYSSAKVAAETRGIGFLLAEGALPVRLRSYRIDDATLARLTERAAHLRRGSRSMVPVGAPEEEPNPEPELDS
jgi:S-DNA-T family DNA segregation ATPase FtsK/SpoIIIE